MCSLRAQTSLQSWNKLSSLSCNLSICQKSAIYDLCDAISGLFLYLNNRAKIRGGLSNINGNAGDNQQHFPAAQLKLAIEQSLAVLGGNLSEAIILELGKQGIDLNSKSSSYSLHEVESTLKGFLGESASSLVLDRIKEHLRPE